MVVVNDAINITLMTVMMMMMIMMTVMCTLAAVDGRSEGTELSARTGASQERTAQSSTGRH